jgi:hypothetical protein
MIPALWHERWVLSELQRLGWQAAPFGQALLPQHIRDGLRECHTLAGRKTPTRWMPDIIALRPPLLRFIDAKAGDRWRDTGNHDIEQDALQAALRWSDALTADVWFIFSDGSGSTARAISLYPGIHPGPFHGNGSGTDFWLVPRAVCQPCMEPTPPMPAGWLPSENPPAQRVVGMAVSTHPGDGAE